MAHMDQSFMCTGGAASVPHHAACEDGRMLQHDGADATWANPLLLAPQHSAAAAIAASNTLRSLESVEQADVHAESARPCKRPRLSSHLLHIHSEPVIDVPEDGAGVTDDEEDPDAVKKHVHRNFVHDGRRNLQRAKHSASKTLPAVEQRSSDIVQVSPRLRDPAPIRLASATDTGPWTRDYRPRDDDGKLKYCHSSGKVGVPGSVPPDTARDRELRRMREYARHRPVTMPFPRKPATVQVLQRPSHELYDPRNPQAFWDFHMPKPSDGLWDEFTAAAAAAKAAAADPVEKHLKGPLQKPSDLQGDQGKLEARGPSSGPLQRQPQVQPQRHALPPTHTTISPAPRAASLLVYAAVGPPTPSSQGRGRAHPLPPTTPTQAIDPRLIFPSPLFPSPLPSPPPSPSLSSYSSSPSLPDSAATPSADANEDVTGEMAQGMTASQAMLAAVSRPHSKLLVVLKVPPGRLQELKTNGFMDGVQRKRGRGRPLGSKNKKKRKAALVGKALLAGKGVLVGKGVKEKGGDDKGGSE